MIFMHGIQADKSILLFGNRVYKISANQVGSISNYKIDVLSGLSQVDYERYGLLIIKKFEMEGEDINGRIKVRNESER